VFARVLSSQRDQRTAAAKVLQGPSGRLEGARADAFVDDVRDALYASKVVAYAQGFEQMAAAAEAYGWDVELGGLATIWRGGCIIRARFLDRIREAYAADPGLRNLLFAEYFRDAVGDAQDAWRRVVAAAVTLGVPTPAFASSLAYYDGFRRERGPANLLQAQRDSSAPTPTSGPTGRAPSTPSGPKAARRSRPSHADSRANRHRPARGRHRPGAGDGRDPEGGERPSGTAMALAPAA
jgi:6-phosphogluconate dehydrogenase (decarboxylating)